jgi:hypothetical protein
VIAARVADFCGEGCLNGHPLRVTTATAIEQSLLTATAEPISGKISQETLAEMIGTTRSRVAIS